MQSSKKCVKIFEYFKNKIGHRGILFLQETHFSIDTEKQWDDEFKDQLYFSHSKTIHAIFLLHLNVVVKKINLMMTMEGF